LKVTEEQKEVFHETVYQKLEGPKIMGKIELPVIKEVKKGNVVKYWCRTTLIRKSVSVFVKVV
jgi:hypothetical protein